MTVMTSEQLHELTANEIEAVSGGVIAIIRPDNQPIEAFIVIGGMDPANHCCHILSVQLEGGHSST